MLRFKPSLYASIMEDNFRIMEERIKMATGQIWNSAAESSTANLDPLYVVVFSG